MMLYIMLMYNAAHNTVNFSQNEKLVYIEK